MLLLILDQALKYGLNSHAAAWEYRNYSVVLFVLHRESGNGFRDRKWSVSCFLSVFRIIAVGFIGYYLYKLVKQNYAFGFIACISLIFAGAIGNIIDSIFYGVVFDHSFGQVASFMPEGGGYASWLHGKVVDMFYFPLIQTVLPEWIPVWGGEEFIFSVRSLTWPIRRFA